MNIENIKKQFPIFNNKVQNNDLVYLDSANSSQKPQVVVDRIYDFYTKEFSNVGRSVHYLAVAATNLYEETRSLMQKYINAKDPNEIVFTKGATEAINLVANTFGQKFLNEGDEIILTELEHHSNYVPWHYLRRSKGVQIKFAEINSEGEISLESIEKLITSKTKMIAITHLSNVTGAILPIKEITQLAHSKNIPVLVDGCQGAPHLKLDMQDIGCDFYSITGHKLYGPSGSGALYVKKDRLSEMIPFIGGGSMIKEVKRESTTFNKAPFKFEAGTPRIVEMIGLGAALDFIGEVGLSNIERHEKELKHYLDSELKPLDWLNIQGHSSTNGAILSFTMDGGAHPHDISTILDRHGIAVRAGHHCAQPLMDHLGLSATCRASFAMYNTKDEVDFLIKALRSCHEIFS